MVDMEENQGGMDFWGWFIIGLLLVCLCAVSALMVAASAPASVVQLEPPETVAEHTPGPTVAELASEPEPPYSEADIALLCKMAWGEARGCAPAEQALCVWTPLNRLDNGGFGSSIEEIVTAERQFIGYAPENPVTEEIRAVVVAVLEAWVAGEPAPALPPYAETGDYLFFSGDGRHNYFRESWR